MLLFSVLLLSVTLTQIGTIVAIAVAVIPAVFWGQRKVVKNVQESITNQSENQHSKETLASIEKTIHILSEKLVGHMDAESKTNEDIKQLGLDLFNELRKMNHNISEGQLNTLKAVITGNNQPANLAKVWKDGYEFIWANKPFLDLTGLSLQEFMSPDGVFLTIHQAEREIIKSTGEAVGQAKTDYVGEYTIVNAKTQESRGIWDVHSHYISGVDDESWYYLATFSPRSKETVSYVTVDPPSVQAGTPDSSNLA